MTEVAVSDTGLVRKVPKDATDEDVAKLYRKLEEESLNRSSGKGALGVSSKEIREIIHEIGLPKMLLSAVLKLIAQKKGLEEYKQQLRMRVVGAVQVKDSGITTEKDEEGRVWIKVEKRGKTKAGE